MSTIKEVARLANVSVGTVSHVISGSVPVSDQLRRRVTEAIRALDYHPNHIARSLKTSRTRILGIVVPDMTIPFFPQVIRGAEAAARKRNYYLVAVNSDDSSNRQREVLSLLRSQRVDGILLVVAAGQGSITQITQIRQSGIPVVCLDRLPENISIDSVCVDDCAAADMGVSHLISMGHQRIAILTGPLTLKNEQDRLQGYNNALTRAGLAVDATLIWEANFHQEEITRICGEHLRDAQRRPAALFSTNGVTGLGVLKALHVCGLNTPDEIAFATFDELTIEEVFRPAITTVVQPAYDIGHRATDILINRIERCMLDASTVSIRLPATLKIRETSLALAHVL